MAVSIQKLEDDNTFLVNGKIIYLDGDGKWISQSELTLKESQDFLKHLTALNTIKTEEIK